MTRKEIISIAMISLAVFVLATVIIATMPFWLPALLIMPELANPIQQQMTKRMTRQLVKGMMKA